ncbi:recombination mediator RecR [candidate division KSB1 bacterium]
MNSGINIIDELIKFFSNLPGIGKRSAQRIVYHLLNYDKDDLTKAAKYLTDLKDKLKFCSRCFNFSSNDICGICSDHKRDKSVICVVEKQEDIVFLEKTGGFKGVYHVLGGVISPLDGITPEKLHIKELVLRMDDNVKEVIIALNPTSEGEATSVYLSRLIKNKDIKITKLARGIPVGSSLEFVDIVTIVKALEGRKTF